MLNTFGMACIYALYSLAFYLAVSGMNGFIFFIRTLFNPSFGYYKVWYQTGEVDKNKTCSTAIVKATTKRKAATKLQSCFKISPVHIRTIEKTKVIA